MSKRRGQSPLSPTPQSLAAVHALDVMMRQAVESHRLGRIPEAERICRSVLQSAPKRFDAHYLLSLILLGQGQFEAAERELKTAIGIDPNIAAAHNNRAVALMSLNRFELALKCLERAVALQPGLAGAFDNRGIVLTKLERYEEAVASFDAALALHTDNFETISNRAAALVYLERFEEALAGYDRALALRPDFPAALTNRGQCLIELDRVKEGLESLRHALSLKPDSDCHSKLIFNLNFDSDSSAALLQTERARWNTLYAAEFSNLAVAHKNKPDPARRLKIGYVSSHFRHQAAMYAFGGAILNHDPSGFELHCYSDTPKEDDLTRRVRASVHKWRHTAELSDDEMAALIREDGIDILVDCVGHMAGHRLLVFARKPAPIQVTAWGEPTGTGLTAMDFLLADPVLVPQNERGPLAERVYDLPNFLGYWMPDHLPEPGPSPAIANGCVTFGSFNRAAKIQEPVLRCWAAILRALPESRLLLKLNQKAVSPAQRSRLETLFRTEDVAPERVELIAPTNRKDHFAAYQRVDIALDPFPHGGGMTSLDALWMGVPVVAQSGPTISSRLAAASLTTLDLRDFIAVDLENYVALAIAKANDLAALAGLRKTLRERLANSVIGDSKRYARAVETAYREMWSQWCASQGLPR